MTILRYKYSTPLGPLYLAASDDGVCEISWRPSNQAQVAHISGRLQAEKFLREACDQLGEYFKGERKKFMLSLLASGTPFQEQVWGALKKVPYGQSRSYGDIAHALKRPGASRAVGTANARNPICIVVPCHRIIRSGGILGEYAGGVVRKRALLELEGVVL